MAPDLSTNGTADPGNTSPSAPSSRPDMSPYIRTYAKDMAMLTKQPSPVADPATAPQPIAAVPAPVVPSSPAHDGVILPEVDLSPVNRPDGASPKQFPSEVVSLTKEDSEGVFAESASIPAAAPTPPTLPRRPHPAPPKPPPAPPVDREAVLARLRKKLAAGNQQGPAPSDPAPQPIEKPAPPKPLPPPPPETLIRPEPVVEPDWKPPPPPRPAPPPSPPPAPPAPLPERESDPLHTYTSDFADRIDREKASTFSVLAAEQDAGPAKKKPSSPRHSFLPVTLAVLLIVLGTGGIYAAYRFTNPVVPGQESLGVPSLIFADEKMELEGPNYRQALADATNEPLVEGNILVTYVTGSSPTAVGEGNTPQPGGVLIRALELGAPDILLRNVDLSSTVGIINAGTETRPFFILRVNSYERTFAGMLGWERRMLDDLAPLYPPYADLAPLAPAADATATGTVPLPPPLPLAPASAEFVDIVVANHDARALKDRFGRTLVLYGYSDKQTLIIARDEAAFTALVARLAATVGN